MRRKPPVDPRTPGCLYWSGYLGRKVRILAMWTDTRSRTTWFLAQTVDDEECRVHCTGWDRTDRLITK